MPCCSRYCTHGRGGRVFVTTTSIWSIGAISTNETLSNFVPSRMRMRFFAALSMTCLLCALSSLESVMPASRSSPLQEKMTLSTW